MKSGQLIYIALLEVITSTSCTNSDNNYSSATKVDSIVMIKTDSAISILPDTPTTKIDTNFSLKNATSTLKSNTEQTERKLPHSLYPLPLVPRFPGGDKAMIDFINENIQYPDAAKKANISGSVLVSFIVKTTGLLTDIKAQKSIGYGCDEEAVRIVSLMPKWIPGEILNKPVDMEYSIAINFKLN